MTADLSALIARLEAAEEVTHALEVEFATFMYANGEAFESVVNYDPELWSERNASPLSSLDAALALAERVLPRMPWTVSRFHRGGAVEYQAAFWMDPEADPSGKGRAPTPALALVIAILRAKQGEGE